MAESTLTLKVTIDSEVRELLEKTLNELDQTQTMAEDIRLELEDMQLRIAVLEGGK